MCTCNPTLGKQKKALVFLASLATLFGKFRVKERHSLDNKKRSTVPRAQRVTPEAIFCLPHTCACTVHPQSQENTSIYTHGKNPD